MTGVIEGSRDDELTVFHNALVKAGFEGPVSCTWYDAFSALNQLKFAAIIIIVQIDAQRFYLRNNFLRVWISEFQQIWPSR